MRKIVAIAAVIMALAGVGFGEWVPLAAKFTIAPLIPEDNESVQFINQSTGPIMFYRWRFGDGAMSWRKNPTHTYKAPGEYAATLTVMDYRYRSKTLTLRVLVIPAMRADFSWTPALPVETLPVQFTDLSTGIDIARWLWDFGDGSMSDEQHPVHTYARAGTYSVTLSIWDTEGAKSQVTMRI